jgi:hypothetical protein
MNFDVWLKANPYPEMKELLMLYGRYNQIPKEAWDDLDKRQAEWREKYRNRTYDANMDKIAGKLKGKF